MSNTRHLRLYIADVQTATGNCRLHRPVLCDKILQAQNTGHVTTTQHAAGLQVIANKRCMNLSYCRILIVY